MALSTMFINERAIVECTAEYGYAEQYRPSDVPEHAALRFEVTLLRFNTDKNIWDISDEQKVIRAKE